MSGGADYQGNLQGCNPGGWERERWFGHVLTEFNGLNYVLYCNRDASVLDTQTHQFELGFPSFCHPNRLDAFLARLLVIEAQESLLRLYTISTVFLDNLERKLQDVGPEQCERW